MTRLTTISLICLTTIATATAGLSALTGGVRVENLRCEYLTNPLGIDVAQPRLSWTLQSRWRGQKQTAYQVLVASTKEMLEDDRAAVGYWAATLLGRLEDSAIAAVESLREAAAGHPSQEVRKRATWALGKIASG